MDQGTSKACPTAPPGALLQPCPAQTPTPVLLPLSLSWCPRSPLPRLLGLPYRTGASRLGLEPWGFPEEGDKAGGPNCPHHRNSILLVISCSGHCNRQEHGILQQNLKGQQTAGSQSPSGHLGGQVPEYHPAVTHPEPQLILAPVCIPPRMTAEQLL